MQEGPLISPGAAVVVSVFSGMSGLRGVCALLEVVGEARVNSSSDDDDENGVDDIDDAAVAVDIGNDDDAVAADDEDNTDDTDEPSNDLVAVVVAVVVVAATGCQGSAVQDSGLVATHLRGTKLLYTAVEQLINKDWEEDKARQDKVLGLWARFREEGVTKYVRVSYHSIELLLHYSIVLLHCYSITLLCYCSVTLLLYWSIARLLCSTITLLLGTHLGTLGR